MASVAKTTSALGSSTRCYAPTLYMPSRSHHSYGYAAVINVPFSWYTVPELLGTPIVHTQALFITVPSPRPQCYYYYFLPQRGKMAVVDRRLLIAGRTARISYRRLPIHSSITAHGPPPSPPHHEPQKQFVIGSSGVFKSGRNSLRRRTCPSEVR